MKLLIVGYGKMGRLVDQLAPDAGHRGRRPRGRGARRVGRRPTWRSTSRPPTRCARNFPALPRAAAAGGDRHDRLVGARAARCAQEAERAGLGVVASANFSIGVNIFQLVVAEAARLMQAQPQYGAWIHEAHHAAKRDAPSGTALLLRDAMTGAGFGRADRHVVHAGRHDSRHAHGRIRRSVGYDRADAHGARPPRDSPAARCVAARWIQGRARLVHDDRRPAVVVAIVSRRRWTGASTMRTPFTGVGTALITPFTKDGSARRGGGQAPGAAADRRGRPLPVAVRHDGRGADAEPPARSCASSSWWSKRPPARVPVLAGAGGYDTREAIELARDMEQGRRRRPAVGHAVLQQADAGRPVSALQGDRREHAAADRALQRAGAHRRSTWTSRPRCGSSEIPNIVGVKEAPGELVQMSEIVAGDAARTSCC